MSQICQMTMILPTPSSSKRSPLPAGTINNIYLLHTKSSCPLDVWKLEQEEAGGFSCSGSINEGSELLLGVCKQDPSTNQAARFTQVFSQVVVSGLPPHNPGCDEAEQRDDFKENKVIGTGVSHLQRVKAPNFYDAEDFEDAETLAEAASRAMWKTENIRAPTQRDVFIRDVPEFCSFLMEMPIHLLTPRNFTRMMLSKTVNVTLRGANSHLQQLDEVFVSRALEDETRVLCCSRRRAQQAAAVSSLKRRYSYICHALQLSRSMQWLLLPSASVHYRIPRDNLRSFGSS